MLSWTLIVCIVALVLLGWFWQASLSVRERANQAAQDACARMQLQFLDGTVAFASLRLTRNETGRITLRRTYVFDYTAGSVERRQGFVVMLGQRIEHIGFERDGESGPAQRHFIPERRDSAVSHDSNVLNLEDWRRRRIVHPEHRPPKSADPGKPSEDSSKDNGW